MRRTALFVIAFAVFVAPAGAASQSPSQADIARWEATAARVTITRDDWGIAHVRGATDADAVFGMEYAQAEDDYPRIEANYAFALGRTALATGEAGIWLDLRARMYADPDSLKAMYARSPASLKKLMDAFADGLNFYLHRHPDADRTSIRRYEPWMALSFTEGSIGGDIERIDLDALQAFYGSQPTETSRATPGAEARRTGQLAGDAAPPLVACIERLAQRAADGEPRGSNGFAVAPKKTLDGHALLFINPHTSFYFRSELQMTSDEGLDAYGAVTWGQFFIYQGFNRTAGWMHTSSGVDNIDWFDETVTEKGGRMFYRYGGRDLPVATKPVTIQYRRRRRVDGRAHVHGLVHAARARRRPERGEVADGEPDVEPGGGADAELHAHEGEGPGRVPGHHEAAHERVQQHRLRRRGRQHRVPALELHPAAEHGVRLEPARAGRQPGDGLRRRPLHRGDAERHQPGRGLGLQLQQLAVVGRGAGQPGGREDYPEYAERGRYETARGLHALKLLPDHDPFTAATLTELAFDSYLPWFAITVPPLVQAYDALPAGDPLRAKLAGPMARLRQWDYRWGVSSVPTSLAVFWGEEMLGHAYRATNRTESMSPPRWVADRAPASLLLSSLSDAVDRLDADFGTWRTPWGHINRFQRISPDIGPHFDDGRHSIPVPFTSSRWGSLASFGARPYPDTKKWYGTSGNSFVAVVEFGDSVRARALTAGGESGHPDSPHFDDEAAIYAMGSLRDVYFYASQLEGHTERVYHPGQ